MEYGSSVVMGRRQLLGHVAGGAMLLGGASSILAGCGGAPTRSPTRPTIVFEPRNSSAASFSSMLGPMKEVLAGFEQQYKVNVNVVVSPGTSGNIAAMLAGSGADIISDLDYAPYVQEGNFLMDLTPLLARDKISTSIWSPAQIKLYQRPNGLFALPDYFGTMVYFINLSDFDNAGVTYPDSSWTSQDLVKLAGQLSTPASGTTPAHYGANIDWDWVDGEENQWAFLGFGGSIINADGTQSTLSQSGSVAAGNWVYEQLLWPGIAAPRVLTGTGYEAQQITSGVVSMSICGTWDLLPVISAVQSSFSWDFLPFPVLPSGRFTLGTNDFYGINAETKYPEQAWQLLRWLSAETTWQIAMMKLLLISPALNSLWETWLSLLVSVVPILKGKNLQWFADAAQQGYAIPRTYYAYEDTAALSILNTYLSELASQKLTNVSQAFALADQQINSFEEQAKSQAAAQEALASQLRSVAKSGGNFPAPSTTGQGVPYTNGSEYVQAQNGVYTLLGDGWDVYGTSDNCVFAGMPVTASVGEWSCRVTAITNLTCPHLSQWSKVGIMARGDLSDDAPLVMAEVTGQHGVQTNVRPVYGQGVKGNVAPDPSLPKASSTTQTSTAAVPPNKSGLVSGIDLTSSNAQAQANYLLKPLWIKLQRKGLIWTVYTSFDGTTWTVAGPTLTAEMGGCWIGIFASAHNGSFGDKGYIRGVVDKLSFTPTIFAQIGQKGIPPAAGPVPSNWATAVAPIAASTARSSGTSTSHASSKAKAGG